MKRRRPPSKTSPPTAGETQSDHVLSLLTSNAKLRRRYLMAKHALKHRIHVNEALSVLHVVLKSTEMGAQQRDNALRLLSKHEQRSSGDNVHAMMMLLPKSWEGLIPDTVGPHRYIPDAEWRLLNDPRSRSIKRKRWLPRSYQLPTEGRHTEEGGDDDDAA